jgi:hypothetical protein
MVHLDFTKIYVNLRYFTLFSVNLRKFTLVKLP